MDDERIPLTGVFATRSSDRPNPIGLHRVTVIGTDPPTSIQVESLEAIDGTPILDLKVAMKKAAGRPQDLVDIEALQMAKRRRRRRARS